ncbi:LOW QUALITY PROTEIN: uncharacterized protein LOC108672298 [Hyalella azteca]|uniref:LOW QUALITY PROTEIN: uncharacterized protein LOC108672298 n=1 Tax=Hyalella azteca TaxID=294128 RepID=A0A979FNZ5_HYAAZ|nr:LOW QUALITY PROTEIN: uncharacterized protein LOC108672298 [Hyalella azteca]
MSRDCCCVRVSALLLVALLLVIHSIPPSLCTSDHRAPPDQIPGQFRSPGHRQDQSPNSDLLKDQPSNPNPVPHRDQNPEEVHEQSLHLSALHDQFMSSYPSSSHDQLRKNKKLSPTSKKKKESPHLSKKTGNILLGHTQSSEIYPDHHQHHDLLFDQFQNPEQMAARSDPPQPPRAHNSSLLQPPSRLHLEASQLGSRQSNKRLPSNSMGVAEQSSVPHVTLHPEPREGKKTGSSGVKNSALSLESEKSYTPHHDERSNSSYTSARKTGDQSRRNGKTSELHHPEEEISLSHTHSSSHGEEKNFSTLKNRLNFPIKSKTRWPRSALGEYFRDHGDLYPGDLLDGAPHSLPVTLDAEHTRVGKPANLIFKDPTYLIAVPRHVHAGRVFRIAVNILPPSPALVIRAALFRDNIELAAVERECEPDLLQLIEIMVPNSSGLGKYRLKVEGSEVGWLVGSAFSREALLTFKPLGPSVLVHTDRPVYMQGDTVRIRVVGVDSAGRPAPESVDVYILSPRGVLVRRWLSRQCGERVVGLQFPLSAEPEEGRWTVRVEEASAVTEHHFIVEYFYPTRFEVDVEVPPFISTDSAVLSGVVYANYTSGAPVSGNVTVRASVRSLLPDRPHLHFAPDPSLLMPVTSFYGAFPFRFHLTDLDDLLPSGGLENSEVTISAQVGDMIWNIRQQGYSKTRIIESKLRLKFLGDSPHILRPAMPFKFYLAATQGSSAPVPESRLSRHRLLVTPEVTLSNGRPDYEVESEVASLALTAELKEAAGGKAYAKLVAVTHHSPGGRFLQISTSTRNPQVGEYVILHVRSNFYLENFRYLLLNKGLIVEAGQEKMEASLHTFPLALDASLAGAATVVVYWTGRGGTLVADSLTFPVNAITRDPVELNVTAMQRSKQPIKLEQSKFASRHPRQVDPIEEAVATEQELMQLPAPDAQGNLSDMLGPVTSDDRSSNVTGEKTDESINNNNTVSSEDEFSEVNVTMNNLSSESSSKPNIESAEFGRLYSPNFSAPAQYSNSSYAIATALLNVTTDSVTISRNVNFVNNYRENSTVMLENLKESGLIFEYEDKSSKNNESNLDADETSSLNHLLHEMNQTINFSSAISSQSSNKFEKESTFSSLSPIITDPSLMVIEERSLLLVHDNVTNMPANHGNYSVFPDFSTNPKPSSPTNDLLNISLIESSNIQLVPIENHTSFLQLQPHQDSAEARGILRSSVQVNKIFKTSLGRDQSSNLSVQFSSNAAFLQEKEMKISSSKLRSSLPTVQSENLPQTSTSNYSEVPKSTSSVSLYSVETTEDLPYIKQGTDSSQVTARSSSNDSQSEKYDIENYFTAESSIESIQPEKYSPKINLNINAESSFADLEYEATVIETDDLNNTDQMYADENTQTVLEDDGAEDMDSLPLPSREHRRRDLRRYEYADDVKEDVLRLTVKGLPGARVSLAGYSWDKFGMAGGSQMSHAQVRLGLPGARVSLAGYSWDKFGMAGGSQMSHAQVLTEMTRPDRPTRGSSSEPHMQQWGAVWSGAEELVRLPRSSLGVDANDTFSLADVLVLTDASDWQLPGPCQDARQLPCLMSGCYSQTSACDGHWDCPDGIDERHCDRLTPAEKDIEEFMLSRQNRLARHVAPPWLWSHVTLNDSGMAALTVLRPYDLASPLVLSGFSLHKHKGLSLLENPVEWVDEDSFQLRVEAPERAGAWEHVGVRVTALNRHLEDVTAHITLAHSEQYKFVALEDFDVAGFDSKQGYQRRRFSEGEHQHTIHVAGGGSITLYLPIVPFTLGEVTVQVTAVIPGKKLRAQVNILVEAMGALQQHHTSLLVDLSNKPYYFTFLDINIPPSQGYVAGSTSALVAVSGDTICPIPTLKHDATRTAERMQRIASPTASSTASLNLPTSGSESAIYSILLTALQLAHLQEQQQLLQPTSHSQLQYQALLAHQGADGGFKFFSQSKSPSCVWLSATAVRALHELSTVAPHLVYVDPQTKDRALRFVLSHQTSFGAWWEPGSVIGARQLQPSSYSFANETTNGLNLTTSAHTLLQLLTLTQLPSPLDERVASAILRGRSWLEHSLRKVERASRPLEAALVALALHEAKSPLAEAAKQSTQDTLAAWEALQQYSIKMGTARDTQISVTVEPLVDPPAGKLTGHSPGHYDQEVPSHTFHITNSNLLHKKLSQRSVNFFFDQLDGSNTCVELVVERWFPVANLTSKLPVTVYEYHAPELKTIEFLDMSEVTFDICQVCGSYQCPNCPEPSYYLSSSTTGAPNGLLLLLVTISSVILSSFPLCSLTSSAKKMYKLYYSLFRIYIVHLLKLVLATAVESVLIIYKRRKVDSGLLIPFGLTAINSLYSWVLSSSLLSSLEIRALQDIIFRCQRLWSAPKDKWFGSAAKAEEQQLNGTKSRNRR